MIYSWSKCFEVRKKAYFQTKVSEKWMVFNLKEKLVKFSAYFEEGDAAVFKLTRFMTRHKKSGKDAKEHDR